MFINPYIKHNWHSKNSQKLRVLILDHFSNALVTSRFPFPKKNLKKNPTFKGFFFSGAKWQMSKYQLWNIAVMLLVHFNGQTSASVHFTAGGITTLGTLEGGKFWKWHVWGFWSMEDDLIEIDLDLPVWVPNKNGSVAQTCQLTTR